MCTLLVVSLPVAWLIERTILVPGLLLPVVAACALRRMGSPVRAVAFALALLALQGLLFERFRSEHQIAWYRPPQRQAGSGGRARRAA